MMEMEMNAEMDKDDASEDGKSKSTVGSSAGTIFCTLEQDYAKLMLEMKDNEALSPYKTEYTRLFEALYKCHQEEEQLLTKFRLLQEETINKTSKISELEQKMEYQEETIKKLNEEIVNMSKLADAAHTREQNAQEIIENLRLTIVKLNYEIEQRNKKISMDEDGSVVKQNENSLKEKERLTNEIETLKQRIKSLSLYVEELETKITAYDEQMIKTQEQIDMQIDEISKGKVIRDRIEKELQELGNEIEIKNGQLQTNNASMKATINSSNKLENSLKEQKNANEKLRKEISKLLVDGMNLQTELDHAGKQVTKLEEILRNKNDEHKILETENKRLKEEIVKCKIEHNNTLKKCEKIEKARIQIENNLAHTEHILKNIETEMSSCRDQIAAEKQNSEWIIRDRNKISKTVEILQDTIKKTQQLLDLSELTKTRIESELEKTVQINSTMNKRLQSLEKEKDKYFQQINNLTQEGEKYVNQIKHKDKEIQDYRKELSSLKSKFRQQQSLFETVRSEKNTCLKSLAGAHDEVRDLRDKVKLINGQIEQVKQDAAAKHNSIVKNEFQSKKVEQEKDAAKFELNTAQKDLSHLRKAIDESKKNEKELRENMKMKNIEVAHLKKEINHVMSDRDVLGTQLVRRNDELSLQYSKIKILRETLCRGESEYAKRLEDIRLLKLEVDKLTMEKALIIKSLENMSDLRHETYHLNRDLTQERLKVTALEEELQNPLNIHRWRKLQGSEPNTDELVKKIQILQKRIIKLNQESILKSKKNNETKKLYLNLRQIILKQPGPEFISDMNKRKIEIKERDQQIKCLTAELNMQEHQTNENSNIIEKLNENLREMQIKYYALKCKDKKVPVQDSTSHSLPAVLSNQKKYCGGGFTMLVAPSRNCWSLESNSK